MKELEQSDKKEFKGVFVPAEILMAQDLTPLQKLLYAEILALSGNDGCFASSSHFAKHLCITERRIRSNLADLEKLGYIERTVTKTNVRVIQIKIFGEVGRKCPKGRTETSGEVGRKRPHKYNNKYNINKNVNRNINTNIKEIDTIDIVKNGLDDICKLYIREISSKTCCSPLETDKLNKLITEYGANKVSEAIEIAVIQNKRSLAYIEGVLKFSGGDENGNSSKEKGMVRQGPTTRCKGLYKQGKVETIESSEAKFANETSGWD